MDQEEARRKVHELDVTVWVGKAGVDAVVDELAGQLDDRDYVKVRFLPAAGDEIDALAADLADRVDAAVVDVRGHTAVYHG